MSNQPVDWRIMHFEKEGDKLLEIIDLGKADISEVKEIICPDDDQEMCGSYLLSSFMLEWLATKFNRKEIEGCAGELFLERDS